MSQTISYLLSSLLAFPGTRVQVGTKMFLSCSSQVLYKVLTYFFHVKVWFSMISSDIKNNPPPNP